MREKVFSLLESILLKLALRPLWMAGLDFLLLGFSLYLGFAVRFGMFLETEWASSLLVALVPFPLTYVGVMALGGSYRVSWAYASVPEFLALSRQHLLSTVLFGLLQYVLPQLRLPRSVFAVAFMAAFLALVFLRLAWRVVGVLGRGGAPSPKRVLVVGAGEAGAMLVREISKYPSLGLPVGFLDDDPEKAGRLIAGVQVLGPIERLPEVARAFGVSAVYVALPSAAGSKIREVLELVRRSGLSLEVKVVPSLYEIARGRVEVSRLRRVEISDLLRREPVKLDSVGIEGYLRDRVVLVTGAGGSIGSELVRQVLPFSPRQLLVLGHGENSIYQLEEEVRPRWPEVSLVPIIADVACEGAMRRVFELYRPQVVFHAAAHKHVPLMEFNACEALRVNAFGSELVAELAGEVGAEKFVLISTDKAVNPTSVMGASKRLAELLVLGLVAPRHPGTDYSVVRFGNVLGSRGSVLLKFQRQIEEGGPVTVTHPEMRRYFMLIPEAVSLVLQAASFGGGRLFVLDMGEQVRVDELARDLIRLCGFEPGRDIKVVYTGLRPGEKLYEELFYDFEEPSPSPHEKVRVARFPFEPDPSFLRNLEDLREAVYSYQEASAVALLRELIPHYQPRYFEASP